MPLRASATVRGDADATQHEALERAVSLLRDEQLGEAEAILVDALRCWPKQPDALHFLGILRHTQGRSEEGIALIREAIAAMPGEAGPWNNLGNMLLECQRLDDALQAYETSAVVAGSRPQAAEPLNNIGTLRRKRLDWQGAESACRQALALQPDFGDAWYNLSLALMGQERVHEGLVANSRAVTLWPRHLQARDHVIRALLLLGKREQATVLYRDWLAEEPDNPVVQHQLRACLGDDELDRASDAYIEMVFDSFARSFDAKLESLNYQAPRLVADALARVLPEPARQFDIADLGCGTGLVGPLIRPWARRLAGCDLSTGMLRKAKDRGVYDVLHKAELVYYLETQPATFDLVVSADTLCYIGDLHATLRAASKALRAEGVFVFTVEATADGEGREHVLQTNGRYAHSQSHLRRAAARAGLQSSSIEGVALRREAGQEVNGWLTVLRRMADE